jgi:molybdate transport system substrate-binding protein
VADLARPGVNVVVCAPEVPCGAAAKKVAAASGVALRPVSEESSVADVLGKVVTGEADAGLVYVTDVKAARGKVIGVPFPEASAAVTTYPIAVLKDSESGGLARDFVALVSGPGGQAVLRTAGFAGP